MSRHRSERAVSARAGVRIGLWAATAYSVFALGIYLLGGGLSRSDESAPILGIILSYYVSGALGGWVVGRLIEHNRTTVGRAGLGLALATLVFTPMVVALFGAPWRWTSDVLLTLTIAVALFGTIIGVLWRDFFT